MPSAYLSANRQVTVLLHLERTYL